MLLIRKKLLRYILFTKRYIDGDETYKILGINLTPKCVIPWWKKMMTLLKYINGLKEGYTIYMNGKTQFKGDVNSSRINLYRCYNFSSNSDIFFEIKQNKPNLNFTWNNKSPKIVKTTIKNNKAGGLPLPDNPNIRPYCLLS